MDANTIILSALCVVFLTMSAFFSGAEIALFSIPRERLAAFEKDGRRSRRLIYSLLVDGQRTLLMLLLGNLFVNITLTGLVNSLVCWLLGRNATLLSFLITSVALIALGDVLPKNGALRWNEKIAAFASPIIYYMKMALSPLLYVIQGVSQFFLAIFKRYLKQPSPFITIDELKSAVYRSFEQGVISKSEQGVIAGLLDRGALPVKRFMIHRSKIPFLPHYTAVSDAVKAMADSGRTFAFVTRGPSRPQVTGIVYLPQLLCAPPGDRCRKFAKTPQWAPETLDAANLISFMFAEKLGVVCVLDEFGGTSGAFSLSEGLSKVMNFRGERAARSSGGSVRIFKGGDEVDGIVEWLPQSLVFAQPDARTLNGLVTRYLGRIPKTGEKFDIDGKNIYIMYAGPNKIETVLIRKEDTEAR
jgi:putative hemolysin